MIYSNLVDLLSYRAQEQPDQIAFTFLVDETTKVELTYQQLDRQARAIAAYLQLTKATGDQALLLYYPGLEFITAFFGCLYAGIVAIPAYVPRNNKLSMERIQAIMSDAQSNIVLTTTQALPKARQQFTQISHPRTLQWLATDNIADNLAEAWRKPTLNDDTLAYLQYTSGSTATPKGVMISHGNAFSNSADMASSWKTTSDSILVLWLPHYHDFGLLYGILQPVYQGCSCFLLSPTSFIRKPIVWLQTISRYKGTHSGAPNFAYDLCVQKISSEQRNTLDLSSWRVAVNGAEPIHFETVKQFAKTFAVCGFHYETFCPGYGLAESTLKVSASCINEKPSFYSVQTAALEKNHVIENSSNDNTTTITLVGCGRPQSDTKVAIIDPTNFNKCPPSVVGEIWVSSPSVAQGYWNRPKETEQTFRAYLADTGEGPFLRTGDLGFLKDEELYVTGRIKDVIIIRGSNYYPQDIERTIEKSHPALRLGAGAAFTLDDEGTPQLVIAQEIERSYLRKLDVEKVITAIRKAVSETYNLYVDTVLLLKTASIPKTSSGKIQRNACRSQLLAKTLNVVGESSSDPKLQFWVPQQQTTLLNPSSSEPTELISRNSHTKVISNNLETIITTEQIQTWVRDWIAKHLKISLHNIDVNRPFTEYGLDSMMSVELIQDFKHWLGNKLELEVNLVWNFPNIKSLADYVNNELKTTKSLSKQKLQSSDSQAQTKISRESAKLSKSQIAADIEREISALETLL